MTDYATIDDIKTLWRDLTDEEESRAEALIPIVCDSLREEAVKVEKDLDAMIEERASLASVAKSVVVDVVGRALMTSTKSEPTTQFSESGFGYTVSGTYLVPGGGLFIKKAELARLGLRRQKVKMVELWPADSEE